MSTNEGGRAFPVMDTDLTGLHCREGGMSLREYFAAKCMEGQVMALGKVLWPGDIPSIAKMSYVMADAMIAARGDT